MLSAIAARKAAANTGSNSSPSAIPVASILPLTDSSPSNTPKLALNSKRKRSQATLFELNSSQSSPSGTPSQSVSASLKKKQKKNVGSKRPFRKQQPRYFDPQQEPEADGFGIEDVITLGQDEDSDIEVDEGVERGMEDLVDSPSNEKKKSKRSYSPSRPIQLDDSSEEGEGEKPQPTTYKEETRPLTTFVPVQGQNLFHLTAEEVSFVSVSSSSAATLIALNPSETLTLLGTYRLSVICGSVQVAGAVLRGPSAKEHSVFAPRSSPLPFIRPLSSAPATGLPPNIQSMIPHNSTVLLLQELHTGVEGLGKVCRTFEGVFASHPKDVTNRGETNEFGDVLKLKGVRIVSQQSKYLSSLSMPSSWEHALNEVHSAPAENHDIEMEAEDEESIRLPPNIYMVKGPKKVGKSSFARILVNRLLTKYSHVAFLECDPGQSEFTPGGLVALNIVHDPLFGPPFTHPTIPVRAHFIGAFSPKTSPGHYIEAVRDLVAYWSGELGFGVSMSKESTGNRSHTIPLVVNTMGWAKGLGADLTKRIQDILMDSLSSLSLESLLAFGSGSESNLKSEMNLYEFDNDIPSGGRPTPGSYPSFFTHVQGVHPSFPPSSNPLPQLHRHQMEPAPGTYLPALTPSIIALGSFSAADHRALNILSYFHAVFPSLSIPAPVHTAARATQWETSLPLLARPPYQVDVNEAVDKVILLPGTADDEVVESEIERVLGGALVALVQCEPGTLDLGVVHVSDTSLKTKTKIPYSPSSLSTPSYLSPGTSSALGLAIIRSLVLGGSHVQILTPLPPSLCSATRVLLKGEMELPIWGLIDFRNLGQSGRGRDGDRDAEKESDMPFLQWDKGVGLGAVKRRVRRNLMRKGQGV
ncbi:hypothetical protein BDP27DRAFT_1447078 [Rhodocollybia butyracea]|uniref:Polynucleotide 5'-hydroxyl-kinase GRC3 n=1 Tax=Rhodocollybia butyracea TaxID=206335 RepID=A0A9P5PQN4_9AGAR|nr:hypothetical protein BDP27DRAFT_1447078 [Rhodocollybia butyracea]